MKQKKTKAEKRMAKVRRTILENIDQDTLNQHFSSIVDSIWAEVCRINDLEPDDFDILLENLVDCCETAWNIAVDCANFKQAEQYIDHVLAKEYSDDEAPILNMIRIAAALKFKLYANERISIIDTDVIWGDEGEFFIEAIFDRDPEEWDRQPVTDIPTLDEILDHDAINKAVEGVPKDKFQDVLKAEIERQIEIYNDTPQDALDGLSPNQADKTKLRNGSGENPAVP